MHKVLLLNASYEPLNICSWKRAVVLLLKGKAVEVEQNGHYLAPGVPQPLVIRLQQYIKIPHKTVPLTRKNLMHRDKHTCQYCARPGGNLTIDHIVPRSKGGQDEWENVVVACLSCNVRKGSKSPEEAGLSLRSKPVRPINFAYFELSKQWHAIREYNVWEKYLYGT